MKSLKRKIHYAYCTIIAYLLYSCAMGNGTIISTNHAITINLDTINKNESFVLSSIFKSLKAIPLDNKEALISRIDKMQPYKNHLFILDFFVAKGVFEFDQEGKFIKKIGNIGNGPGEYASCDDFTINEQSEEIYIYDSSYKRINKYDIQSGKYKGSLNLEKLNSPHRIKVNSGRLYAINSYSPSAASHPYNILEEINVNNGEKIGEWMDADQYNKGWTLPGLSTNFFYSIDENTDLLSFGIGDTIMCIRDGELYPYIVLTGKKVSRKEEISRGEKLSTDPSMRSRKMIESIMKLMKQDKIINISNIYRYKHNLYFECMGAVSYLVEYDETTGKYSVFDSSSKDDLMFSKYPEHRSVPVFLNSDKKGVYYFVGVDYLPELKHFATEKGVMSDKVINKDKLEKLDDDSNPVILYYEYKK